MYKPKINDVNYKKVKWTLVDDSHRFFNLWRSDVGSYLECFDKNENPNLTHPYGQLLVKESLTKYMNAMERWG